jgi:hypothetical protein
LNPIFPWLPVGFDLGYGQESGRLLNEGSGYQLVATRRGHNTILLLDAAHLPPSHALTRVQAQARAVSFGGKTLLATVYEEDASPIRAGDIPKNSAALTSLEIEAIMRGYQSFKEETPNCGWVDSIFVIADEMFIPTNMMPDPDQHRSLAVAIMTGGVIDEELSANQVRSFNRWLTIGEIDAFLNLTAPPVSAGKWPASPPEQKTGALPDGANRREDAPARDGGARPGKPFYLAGQPAFTAMANDYIVDLVSNPQGYEAMGVRMPNGILLHGPTGSGKTFAARKLAAWIGWTVMEIGLGQVGSSYIHQTANRFRRLFDAAEAKGPTLIIMDEIDALMGSRSADSHDHKIEEVNELLRLVEGASERGILVVGTTNRPEALDVAFLRKGRFDVQIEIAYPSPEQIAELMSSMLEQRPHVPGINVGPLAAKMVGRPVSDIEWLINEAARLAVKAEKDAIDDMCLFKAVGSLAK